MQSKSSAMPGFKIFDSILKFQPAVQRKNCTRQPREEPLVGHNAVWTLWVFGETADDAQIFDRAKTPFGYDSLCESAKNNRHTWPRTNTVRNSPSVREQRRVTECKPIGLVLRSTAVRGPTFFAFSPRTSLLIRFGREMRTKHTIRIRYTAAYSRARLVHAKLFVKLPNTAGKSTLAARSTFIFRTVAVTCACGNVFEQYTHVTLKFPSKGWRVTGKSGMEPLSRGESRRTTGRRARKILNAYFKMSTAPRHMCTCLCGN